MTYEEYLIQSKSMTAEETADLWERLDEYQIYAEDAVLVLVGDYEGQEGYMDGAYLEDDDLYLWINIDGEMHAIPAEQLELVPEKCSWY